ncbi:hypothetical protein MBLNU230_g6521t1 [Neophaeotheca triangularis]
MPNKPHAPRANGKPNNNSNSKKNATPANSNNEDGSYIVFSKSDKPSKKAKQNAAAAAAAPQNPASSTTKGKQPTPLHPTEPPKPSTREIIAGTSWTGKLPQTLLNEHAQKQHWERVEYHVQGNSNRGFTGSVTLRQKNSKTQEVLTLPPILPPQPYLKEKATQPSAVEARHFAAAFALHRVANGKNLHMMLPPVYRDLWKGEFEGLRKEAVERGEGWLYEADPFTAWRAREEERVRRNKAREERERRVEAERKNAVVGLDGQVQDKGVLKGWQRVPKVEMGRGMRREVEGLVRRDGVWNPYGLGMDKAETEKVVAELERSGFRRSHAEEAAGICGDGEECLEWLLIHVPEDDLPKWALPENYTAGVSLASGDLKREGKIKRLAASGYAPEVCGDVLDRYEGDEGRAAAALQKLLSPDEEEVEDSDADEDGLSIWDEELETLAAIFGDRCTKNNKILSILLELQTPSKQPITLHTRPPPNNYPNAVPILSIDAALPAYIRLSILKQCINATKTHFLGDQMLFNIVDWLEHEIPTIIERPGSLSAIASAASTTIDASNPSPTPPRPRQNTRKPKPITWTPHTPASQTLLSALQTRNTTAAQQSKLGARQTLPAWNLRTLIASSVAENQVTIVSGETGSGKSTQSVQFILDDLITRGFGDCANIVCTQPRRISALGLADRVADERCGRVGEEVGYAIRGEQRVRKGVTKLCFVTTGVLLRRLQTSGGAEQDVLDALADVSHVVVDEVHERSLDTDFLLVLLRGVLRKRRDLRLVLMSATLDAGVFERYFAKDGLSVGGVEIEGRTFPVRDVYLDEIVRGTGFGGFQGGEEEVEAMEGLSLDGGSKSGEDNKGLGQALRSVGMRINYDLIAQTVRLIDSELGGADGGILIFLPGVAEIDQTLRALRSIPNLHTLPLHASLQSSEQRRVFHAPPRGQRKVVAATNVAETSITIDDIVAVIDTGRVKETSFDPANNMVKLAEVWASRAACKQRRGRAGRVRAGTCYKLYTRSAETKMAERPEPEIRRVPLEQLCLSVKAMGILDVPAFLGSALTPPESLAVEGALELLQRMGALDKTELTALGRHLSMIPADLRCGKLMVYGAAFGCLEACISIASILTVKSPFVSPQAKREEAKAARATFCNGSQGDLLCDLNAYNQWSERRSAGEATSVLRRWCDENFLSHQTLLDISTTRTQYFSSLQEIGFLQSSNGKDNNTSTASVPSPLLRALIAAAMTPQLARVDYPTQKYAPTASGTLALDPEAQAIKYYNQHNGRIFLHPSSTLFSTQTYPPNTSYLAYFTKMATSKIFIREVTPFNTFGLLMFCGGIEVDKSGRGLVVDGWVRVRGWARLGVLVGRLRGMLDRVLERKVEEPGWRMEGAEVVGLVRRLVELDGLDR